MRIEEPREEERHDRLHSIALELANTCSVQDVRRVIADIGTVVLGASRVRLWTVERRVVRLVDAQTPCAVELSDVFHPVVQAIVSAEPLWSSRFTTANDTAQDSLPACVLPLIVDGRVVAAIELELATTGDRRFLLAIASEVGAAIDRVRLPVIEWPTGSVRIEVLDPDLRRVLIVDDDPDVAESFAGTLETLGHEAIVVYNGKAAIRAAEQFVADIVFIELGLSSTDGYELAARLHQMPGWEATRIIAIASTERSNARERARSAGFEQLVLKPLDHPTVGTILSSVTAR